MCVQDIDHEALPVLPEHVQEKYKGWWGRYRSRSFELQACTLVYSLSKVKLRVADGSPYP